MRSGSNPGFAIGTAFGFPVFVEMSALYLGPLLLLVALHQSSGVDLLRALIFVALAVGSVLAHELAHALTARALGVPVRHIALTWFGGYASFWVQPTRWRDAAIAFAGPAANLLIASILFAILAVLPSQDATWIEGADIYVRPHNPNLIEYAVRAGAFLNLALGLFNLLPGLPLDGGHILRTVLSTRMSLGRAGWIAAWAGIVIGVVAIAYAIWVESFAILFVGLFVAGSAWGERRAMR
ncbi:MAG: site-2 protease family protein [Hyphomonadaceae bacterium]|nr:site-2 protease family protein [Hyphomonadaceae bacterium]